MKPQCESLHKGITLKNGCENEYIFGDTAAVIPYRVGIVFITHILPDAASSFEWTGAVGLTWPRDWA